MTKTVNSKVVPVQNISEVANSLTDVFLSFESKVSEVEQAIATTKAQQLQAMQKTLSGIKPVSGSDFDQHWKSNVEQKIRSTGKYKPESVPAMVSRLKVATIALTNGVEPEAGEILKNYVGRAREVIKAKGIYAPAKAGAPKKPVIAKKLSGREEALALICENNTKRMGLLDTIFSDHADDFEKWASNFLAKQALANASK